jgi:NCS1 family nucleobase:cation symporter-1
MSRERGTDGTDNTGNTDNTGKTGDTHGTDGSRPTEKPNANSIVERNIFFGIVPVLKREKIYGFLDAFLILSGYNIATWSYTQGSYLATLVGFKQLLIGAFIGAILMLVIYQLPVVLSTRYGIDIWIWLRAVFGHKGVLIISVVIIIINYPWYAVSAEMFASSMSNLAGLFGVDLPGGAHLALALFCVILGTAIAYKGIHAMTLTTRILVPLLFAVGVMVVIVGFTAVPFDVIWNYHPAASGAGTAGTGTGAASGSGGNIIPYIVSVEANFAFAMTLVGGMAEMPRLTRTERSAFWSGVFAQGLSGSFFVTIGAIMSIAMQYVTHEMIDDPTLMLATLTTPAMAFSSLLLVAFANIGTQTVGSYIYGVVLKSSFTKADYRIIIVILAAYVSLLCVWGKITEYFGSFLTISACIYAPLAALLFVDFFLVRKQKISLRSAFRLPGYHAYDYPLGINLLGFICIAAGVVMSLAIYNPVSGEVHNMFLFHLTPTGASFLGTGILYYALCRLPAVRRRMLRDRSEITV